MGGPDTAAIVSSILNASWMVRHYARGGRTSIQREQRQLAIVHLGETVRDALNTSSDYEPILAAICDGLRPRDEQPF